MRLSQERLSWLRSVADRRSVADGGLREADLVDLHAGQHLPVAGATTHGFATAEFLDHDLRAGIDRDTLAVTVAPDNVGSPNFRLEPSL